MERDKVRAMSCTDRKDGDVPELREASVHGHLSRLIKATVDHIAMASPLRAPSGSRRGGSLLAYRTKELEQAKARLYGGPHARRGIWADSEWSRAVLAGGPLVGGLTW